MAEQLNESLFLNACKRKATSRTPIWLMRQAGRYMAVYRALREKNTLLELVKNPELACEVTLQPIRAFGLDAAIIFADILPLLENLGFTIEFMKGEGPHIHNPIRSVQDVERIHNRSVEETLWFTLNAIRLVRKELDPVRTPLIGFSGAPFTLASYAIEGGSSRDYRLTKQFMYQEPDAWHLLMQKMSIAVADYLIAQAKAGAQALQIFDSWVGALSPKDFQRFVMPYLLQIVSRAKEANVPLIYFSTATSGILHLIKDLPVDVIGVDWRIDLKQAWNTLGTHRAIQGNLDPIALYAPWPELKDQVEHILSCAGEIHQTRCGFIFNLGHGILPTTPEDNVKRLVDYISTGY